MRWWSRCILIGTATAAWLARVPEGYLYQFVNGGLIQGRRRGQSARQQRTPALAGGYFPGNDQGTSEGTSTLVDETRALREHIQTLAAELRLLRETLQQPQSSAGVKSSAPPAMGSVGDQPLRQSTVQGASTARPTSSPAQQPPVPSPAPSRVQQSAAPSGGSLVRIASAGYESGNRADILVDDRLVPVPGVSDNRGLSVVAVDPTDGQVLTSRAYDIWADPFSNNRQLSADLGGLPDGTVVLIALKDSGMENLDTTGLSALQSVGSTLSAALGVREGYALIGSKGGVAFAEEKGAQVEVQAELPFPVRELTAKRPTVFQQEARGVAPASPFTQPQAQVQSPSAAPPRTPMNPSSGVSFGAAAGQAGRGEEDPSLMLDQLQQRIQAKRLGREPPSA